MTTNATIYIEDKTTKPKIIVFSPEKKIIGLQFDLNYIEPYNANTDIVSGIGIWDAKGSESTVICYPRVNKLSSSYKIDKINKRGRFSVCILPKSINGTLSNIKMVYQNENDSNDFLSIKQPQ